MRVLIGCEFSAIVRDAFRKRGHDAWSCDLLETEGDPRWHIQGDVLQVMSDDWDLGIFHPHCTYLTNASVRWFTTIPKKPKPGVLYGPERWEAMYEAAAFFRLLLNCRIPKIAVENPIPHGYAVEEIGRSYDQHIQPWMFGVGETKGTCLWLKNLPPLVPTKVVAGREPKVHYASPGENRWKDRSRTCLGIAAAMAEQWG